MTQKTFPSTGVAEEVSAAAEWPAARQGPSVPSERITVALIPTAEIGLRRLQQRMNLSKTDLTNRAITSYEFLEAQLQAGRDLIVRDRKTGESQLVRFL